LANHISYESKIKQKRGQGAGKNYKPWYRVGEKNSNAHGQKSRGNGHCIKGLKTKRSHHLLSNFELMIFMVFDLNSEIADIREQFPLLDIDLAKKNSNELGIKYPNHTENHVLTSDFFIDFKDGKQKAITFKPISNLNDRQLQLFQIEKSYWESLGIQWELMTDMDIPSEKIFLQNYADIYYSVSSFHNKDFSISKVQDFYSHLSLNYQRCEHVGIVNYCLQADQDLSFDTGLSLRILKVLLGRQIIKSDLKKNLFSNQIELNSIKILKNVKHIDKSDLAA
jgi:hypothetical protein